MGNGSFLPPWVLQVFGLVLITVFVIVKIKTGQESALLVGVGVTFAVAGGAQGAYNRAKRSIYKGQPHEGDAPDTHEREREQ